MPDRVPVGAPRHRRVRGMWMRGLHREQAGGRGFRRLPRPPRPHGLEPVPVPGPSVARRAVGEHGPLPPRRPAGRGVAVLANDLTAASPRTRHSRGFHGNASHRHDLLLTHPRRRRDGAGRTSHDVRNGTDRADGPGGGPAGIAGSACGHRSGNRDGAAAPVRISVRDDPKARRCGYPRATITASEPCGARHIRGDGTPAGDRTSERGTTHIRMDAARCGEIRSAGKRAAERGEQDRDSGALRPRARTRERDR